MSDTHRSSAGTDGQPGRRIAIAVAIAVVLLVGSVALVVSQRSTDDAAPVSTPEDTSGAETASPDPAAAPDPAPSGPVSGDEQPDEADAAPPETPAAPSFDVVRVDGAGETVVAGRAAPGARVTLSIDGTEIETAETDASGDFVALLTLPPSPAPRVLGVASTAADGSEQAGSETIIVSPFGATEPPPPAAETGDAETDRAAVAAPDAAGSRQTANASPGAVETGAPSDDPTAPEADASPPDATAPTVSESPTGRGEPGAVPAADPSSGPEAAEPPTILRAGQDGVEIVQGPGPAPAAQSEIRLDAITYDTEGDVSLAGRGPAASSVRVSLDNRPIELGEIDADGRWSLELPDVDAGTYTLRIEEIGPDGGVGSTIETPFLREDPARIRNDPMLVAPGSSVITVQRGFTLWGIARANFGSGILYVQIFEENRGDIRDPDLIFPGQIFALPDLPRVGPSP